MCARGECNARFQISPGGDIQTQYFQACTGSPENYNILSHELRIEASSPDGSVLTTATIVEKYPDVTLHSPGMQNWNDDTSTVADHFLGGSVSRWHRKENKLELLSVLSRSACIFDSYASLVRHAILTRRVILELLSVLSLSLHGRACLFDRYDDVIGEVPPILTRW